VQIDASSRRCHLHYNQIVKDHFTTYKPEGLFIMPSTGWEVGPSNRRNNFSFSSWAVFASRKAVQSGKKQSYGVWPKASTRRKRFFRCVIRDSRRSVTLSNSEKSVKKSSSSVVIRVLESGARGEMLVRAFGVQFSAFQAAFSAGNRTQKTENSPLTQWRRRGSNPQPLPCKGSALPIELRPRLPVGGRRVELLTSSLSATRSNQLS
jgi:hypothetical protein